MRGSKLVKQGDITHFRRRLLSWFENSQRALPWRGESDPYRILVSEIMLQQTRVAVVEKRYKSFIRRFPTAARLARAREQTVLAAWSGLGYYRRARSLQAAAKEIAGNGGFPRTADALLKLPGVGRYTAAAVASIAFGEPVAVVDGNVKRVLERLSGRAWREEHYWKLAGELLDDQRPGDFNQAMMELGATVCVPTGEPLCGACPVAELCVSQGVKLKRKQAVRRKAVIHYVLARKNGSVLLRQRPPGSALMPGMWELPECRAQSQEPSLRLRHSITDTDYTVNVFAGGKGHNGKWVPLRRLERMALTGLARKILGHAGALRPKNS